MKTMPRKALAKAIRELVDGAVWPPPLRFALEDADFLLSALQSAGYAVVPVEPSREMCRAGQRAINEDSDWDAGTIYRAMLTASDSGQEKKETK